MAVLGSFASAQDQPPPRVTTPGAPGSQVQINQIETSQFPKVVVFATVLKDGQPVQGLTGKDFRVREDEVDQEPLTVIPKLTPLSVVMTLDTSGSMKSRLSDAQSAAKSFLNTLETQDKVQVIRFSRDVKTIFPLGADRGGAETAIGSTAARGDTALWDALFASLETLQSVPGRKAIVLLSDGVDDDGTGKPLSKKTVTDVLALARRVNVPIYAIGLGRELDEVNLRKVATDSGALYLNATEPTELKRLYDSIGKQLAGQYTINYTSNLPADGSEHRVQLKVGSVASTKSYTPPARVAVRENPPVEPTSPPPVAQEGPGTAISDKAPSSDIKAPVPLVLGEVVKGRLGSSDETKKYHYWLLDLPAGKYKFVLDVKRADDKDSNIGGKLFIINPDGKKGTRIGIMNQINHRHRSVFRIESEQALQGVLRYENDFTISDYHFGIFRESDRLNGLFFVKPPPVVPIKLGQSVTTPVLDGENTQKRDVYYSLKLPAADYKVTLEFRRQDKKDSNVGGVVSALDPDGDERIDHVVIVNKTGPAHQEAAKLSLADEADLIFMVRANFTKETAVFAVENWTE